MKIDLTTRKLTTAYSQSLHSNKIQLTHWQDGFVDDNQLIRVTSLNSSSHIKDQTKFSGEKWV